MKTKKIIITILLIICAFCSLIRINTAEVSAYSVLDNVNAKSYVVVDQSGNILIEKNSNDKKEVASICKLMTTLITLENIDKGNISLDTKLVASEKAASAEGSQAFLDARSSYSVRDLLKSVIVASANDSAIVLAEGIAGSEDNFVKMMNEKAKSLGMKNTLYNNSTGLPAMEQYSTAYDTTILLNEVSKYDIYREDCQIWMDSLTHPSGRETELVNTNRLIKYYEFCKTGKTGFTDEAGYCLSSTAEKDGMKLTCVVLGCASSADRFKDSVCLYNYCYANFQNNLVLSHETTISELPVLRGKTDTIKIRPAEDFYYTQDRNQEKSVSIRLNLPQSLSAPIENGDIAGEILIIVDGEVVGEIDAIASEPVEKQNYVDVIHKIVENFDLIGR